MVGGRIRLLCLVAHLCFLCVGPVARAQHAKAAEQLRVQSYLKHPSKLSFKGSAALQRLYYRAYEYVSRDRHITAQEELRLGNLRKRIRKLIRVAREKGAEVIGKRESK